jgi:hypothetical protein
MATVAIVAKGIQIPSDELSSVASAINVQVNRDLIKPWNVQASVTAFQDDAEPLARGFVPVYIVADTGDSDGVHRHPENGTLFALVRYSPGMRWSILAHPISVGHIPGTGPTRLEPCAACPYIVRML